MAKSSLALVLVSIAALGLAGCASSGGRHHRSDAGEPAVPAIAMSGQQTFFAGQIRAEATLGQGRGAHFADEPKGGGGSGSGGRRGGSSGGGGHHRGGGMGGAEGMGDGPSIHMRGSPLPPVKLRFRLANLGSTALTVRIVDLKSDLGDFAVQPDQLTLDPGKTTEVDPMFSQLGVNGDEIPVTIVLQLGNKKETHDLILKLLPTPAPDAPPAEAPPADAEKK
ncbi:MAG: hypothetical protein JSS11_07470 [Verrucomicrobia bacterium]|nr:hypothetical protein [Verrucomicrobiota bacterium]